MARITARWLITRVTVALSVIGIYQIVIYIRLTNPVSRPMECMCSSEIPARSTPQPTTFSKVFKSERSTAKSTYSVKTLQRKERKQLAGRLKRLALELSETQRTVVSLPVYHRLGNHVNTINGILESIMEQPVHNVNTFGSEKMKRTAEKQQGHVVCPEKFQGKNLAYGYPWFRTGFERVNCSDYIPMKNLVTILLHLQKQLPKPSKDLKSLLENIATAYPGAQIRLATSDQDISLGDVALIAKLNISFVHQANSKAVQGELWSELLDDVTTPYVLVASDVTQFNDDVNLERLIRVLSTNKEVVIAGGGHRNEKGEWDLGCQQTMIRNWTMHYRGGYYYSFQDCVVCDFLSGPWVAKTDTLKELGFDKKLPYGAFHDMFWRLKRSKPGSIALSCPDVMFNINTNNVPDHYYVALAKKWDIKKWIEPDGQVRWYGCRRGYAHTSGTQSCSLTKGLGVPPCDLENLADAIKFVMKECEEAGLFCELQEGTLLGAVKLNKVLPWERDADITFLTANYSAFKKLKSKFDKQGYTLSDDDESLWCCVDGRKAGGKFRVGTSRFTIEMYGQHMMESELLVASGHQPTKIHFAGAWVNVVRNPGLYARNRYGPNHFRHEEHWMDLGHDTGWAFYNPGTFSKCEDPGHSACLDQYPADGNLQFSDYVTL